ncbi:Serine/threonine-protein kinase Sgk1 [Desmophyllum pertusum]|uniref:Serine/threonine-protein kinase Sgk1 n=1 Tax=Desmophyllum pertusum TaxID=174260 RepID=A0A9W9Z3P6_9CNID|nr:Serine/threonine-protein kinase Sgk1 [Desmophyllum pertusum]
MSKQIGVSVPDSETLSSEKSKRFTVYKVLVKLPDGRSYFIFRRYNEFYNLYEKIKKVFPELNIKLPGKRRLGNNFDPEFIKMRREGLNEFTSKIISHPNAIEHPDVRLFLSLDNPKNAQVNVDAEQFGADEADSLAKDLNKIDLGDSYNQKAKPSDFLFLKVIGKGSFGKVFLAKNKQEDQFYAIKVLNKAAIRKRNEAKHIMAERNVLLMNVKHPFLVGLHYSFQTRDKLYFVLDYVNGGELFFHLQKKDTFQNQEIASAIGYLHSLQIIYRDLKPENILLDHKGHVVLTDFGLCKEGIEPSGTTSTFCGTPEHQKFFGNRSTDKTVDWWCLGAVLYEMMYGLPPFYSRDTAEMYDNILHKPLRLRTNISASARNVLEGLLQKDRSKRLGVAGENDFEAIKNHPFFRSIDWQLLYDRKVEPPYNPNVTGQLDLRHFDPEFVREPVPGSVGKSADSAFLSASVDDPDDAFVGFTYVAPMEEVLHE